MIKRQAESEVLSALGDTPVVLIHGPRQCGKSTLSKLIGEQTGARYVTLDEPLPRELAHENPNRFLETYKGPLIIDEIQRAPKLFLAIKASVDKDRTPGRFLLTGSANVLALPKIADSLAGRMAIIDLLPFSQAEIEGCEHNFVDRLFDPEPLAYETSGDEGDLLNRIVRGGFPEPFARSIPKRREAWFADYVRSLLERDIRDLANIEGLAQVPKLLRLLAAKSGEATNVVGLTRETNIPSTSLHRYLDLLQAVFLVHNVPAWSTDQAVRLTKTAKSYLVDSGLFCYLLNQNVAALAADPDKKVHALKSFVAMELRRLRSGSEVKPEIYHLRTVKQLEVDFVLESRSGEVVGVQVEADAALNRRDVEPLSFLAELAGSHFRRGIVLYGGNVVEPLAPNISAVPFAALWSKPSA